MQISAFRNVVGVLMITVSMAASGATANRDVETVMNSAKSKMMVGDFEGAAVIYYRALQVDNPDPAIRRALATLLIEAHTNEPEAEHSDLLEAIEDDVPDASLS